MKKTILKVATTAAAVALAVTGTATAADASVTSTQHTTARTAAVNKNGTLTWGWALPSTWDPVTSAVGNDVSALTLTYEGLTEENAKGNAVPGLAKSWSYNSTGTAITFHLRSGLTFSDGTKLDATAVKESLTRGLSDKASTVAAQMADIGSITADSATKVTLHLTQADYQIPLLMSGKTGQIVSPTASSKNEAGLATQPVGAGPFILTSYTPGSQAVLKRNPNFWDAKKIYIKNFILKNTPAASVASAGLESGQFDMVDLQASQVSAIKSAGFPIEQTSVLPVRALDINNTVKPFSNPKVVEAINYAINRKQIIAAANFGYGSVAYQPFPAGYVAHNKSLDDLYPHNVKKAKALLKAAGYPKGISVTLAFATANDPVAELLQQQLAAAGITAKLKVQTPGVNNYITLTDPFVLDQFNARQSPVQALQVLFGSTGLMNLGKGTPANLAAAVSKASSLPLTSSAYPAAIQAATKIAVTKMPNVFLYSVTRFEAHTTKVHGLRHWVDIQRFEGVSVDK